jgi:hypothetical protein
MIYIQALAICTSKTPCDLLAPKSSEHASDSDDKESLVQLCDVSDNAVLDYPRMLSWTVRMFVCYWLIRTLMSMASLTRRRPLRGYWVPDANGTDF